MADTEPTIAGKARAETIAEKASRLVALLEPLRGQLDGVRVKLVGPVPVSPTTGEKMPEADCLRSALGRALDLATEIGEIATDLEASV